jgi:hypothetical protein
VLAATPESERRFRQLPQLRDDGLVGHVVPYTEDFLASLAK